MVSKKTRKRLRQETGLIIGTQIGSQVLEGLPASITRTQGQQFFTRFSGGFGLLGRVEGISLVLEGTRQLQKATKRKKR